MVYAAQTAGDGSEGRLVTMHTFTDSWEVHPFGEELVLCIEGVITLHHEVDGAVQSTTIEQDEAIINPLGCGTPLT